MAFKFKRSGAVDLLAVDKRFFYQHEVSIYALPSYSWLRYSDISNQSSKGYFNVGAGIDYRFFFHQNIGVSMGLQWLKYNGDYKYDAFEQTVSGIDNTDPLFPDNPYQYIERYYVTEKANLHFLEVPIKVLFITPSWERVQFRSAIGINIGYNIATKQHLSGYYDAEMKYTNQNITVDYSESLLLGRFTNINISSPNTILKPHISVLAEIGIGIKMSERWQINFDLYGSYSFNNLHSTHKEFISMKNDYTGIATTNLVGDIHSLAAGCRIGISVYLGKPKEEIVTPWKKRALKGLNDNLDFSVSDINLPDKITSEQIGSTSTEDITEIEEVKDIEVVKEFEEIKEIEENKEIEEIEEIKEIEEIEDIKEIEEIEEIEEVEEVVEQKIIENEVAEIKIIEKTKALNSPILFEKDSYNVSYYSLRIIQIIAASILENPPTKIILVGYTCDIGSDISNYELGLKRAQEVQAILKAYGVTNIPIETTSKGETNPPLQNIDEEHREKNRRVELIYIY
jgi:outer membrane protein OmpA-like peptidoglycan-associated protein